MTSGVATCCSCSPAKSFPSTADVEREAAVLDESALTGEALPVEHEAGDAIRSGVVNAGGPFDLRATTSASESTYSGIVRLVSEAAASTAPFVRLADRYAGVFLAAQPRARRARPGRSRATSSARSRCWSSPPRAR